MTPRFRDRLAARRRGMDREGAPCLLIEKYCSRDIMSRSPRKEKIMGKNGFRLAAALAWAFVLAGCTSLSDSEQRLETAKDFSISEYKTAALIVSRVGNSVRWMCPARISLDTDYANEKPVRGENVLGAYAAKDVIIENDKMIRRRLPSYPYVMRISDSLYMKFHKNITPLVFETASAALSEKGLRVIDGLTSLASEGLDPYAMTVGEMVDKLSSRCDCVVFLHYEDHGEYNWVTTSKETGVLREITVTDKNHGSGFTGISYAFSLFDGRSRASRLAGYENVDIMKLIDDMRENPGSTEWLIKTETRSGIAGVAETTDTGMKILLNEKDLWFVFRDYLLDGTRNLSGESKIKGLREYLSIKGANKKK
jgi:hypothetical protein